MDTTKINQLTLYPVACFITGSTPNGGGLWKYILRKFPESLLNANKPVMTQALHFLDFKTSSKNLCNFWRKRSLREHYNGQFGIDYKARIFTDSGGYTLMFDPDLDLSAFGLLKTHLPEEILKLQIDYGANFVVSLDYPIPPNLDCEEAKLRQAKTLDAALRSARLLKSLDSDKTPKLYLPIHGLTTETLSAFTNELLEKLDKENLLDVIEGFALGSMVPRRKKGRSDEVVAFTKAAHKAIPNGMPLHIFGISGVLMPYLIAEGATSFDTSGYVQNGRSLKYFEPETRRLIPFRKLKKYPCDCSICRGRDIKLDKDTLDGKTEKEKSEVYAVICLHNLEVEYRLLESTKRALIEGRLESFLQELPKLYPKLRWPIQHINSREKNATGSQGNTFEIKIHTHTPADFDIQTLSWEPIRTRKVALVLPCSQEKPYTNSQSYRRVWNYLSQRLTSVILSQIDIIFLSGLYGPVPGSFVYNDAVMTYDFRLHYRDIAGKNRVAERLSAFLDKYASNYNGVVGYIAQPAYRKAFQQGTNGFENVWLLPTERITTSSFAKRINLTSLAETLEILVKAEQ